MTDFTSIKSLKIFIQEVGIKSFLKSTLSLYPVLSEDIIEVLV